MKPFNTEPSTPADLILVTGATGKTGRRVVQRLRDRGIGTRAVSRRSDIPFDWDDTGTWSAALAGATAVYISYAPDLAIPGAKATIRHFVHEAVEAGVRRIVLLSGRGEAEAQACERIVQNSGVKWTVVRASWFMQNFSEGEFSGMIREGVITLPAANIPEPFIDVNDIADVAVAALTEPGHDSEIYEVTGPQLLTFADLADALSDASGRDIRFMRLPREAFSDAVRNSGAPEGVAWLLDYLFDTVLDGRNAYVADGVQRALGREPADFRTFAKRMNDVAQPAGTGH